MGYFVLIKVDICVRVQCIRSRRPDEGIQRHSSSCPSELVTVRMRLHISSFQYHSISSSSRTLLCSSLTVQFAKNDSDQTFTLVECPSKCLDNSEFIHMITEVEKGGTGQLISRLTNDDIDVAM